MMYVPKISSRSRMIERGTQHLRNSDYRYYIMVQCNGVVYVQRSNFTEKEQQKSRPLAPLTRALWQALESFSLKDPYTAIFLAFYSRGRW